MLNVRWANICAGRELNVLWNVNNHRTRAARPRDMKRLMQNARQVIDVFDKPVVLGAGPRNADGIAFLERVVANQVRWHLTGDANNRNGIHQCIGQTGNSVGCARAGCDKHDADLA